MAKLLDARGEEAVVGRTHGYWLDAGDFVSTESSGVDALNPGALGFPRDWPAVYTQSALLKSLVGKRGRLAGRRVAVAGAPTPEERARAPGLAFYPLQSFANAERAAGHVAEMTVVRGWAVFELLDRPPGAAFVAERYWWNAFPDGRWIDFTPRPEAWPRLLLAEAASNAPKFQSVLTARDAEVAARLLGQRFHPAPAASAAAAQPSSELVPVRTSRPPAPRPSAPAALPETSATATPKGGQAAARAAGEFMAQEKLAHAASKLREAIRLEADPIMSLNNRINLGAVLHRLGADDQALAVLRDALPRLRELQPQAAKAPPEARKHLTYLECVLHINLGCSLKGGTQEQREHFERALRVDPSCVEALFQMASHCADSEGDPDGALQYLQRALALNPDDLSCVALSSRCLERAGRHQEALTALEKLITLDVASMYVGLRQVFRCRQGDVFVVTYPRCGTTWMVQVVACILHGSAADYDLHARFVEGMLATAPNQVWGLETMQAPRIMKMHVPGDMHPGLLHGSETELQEDGQAVYVVRNPKDTLVSLRHHHANNKAIAWTGTWDEWVDQWLAGDRSREYGGTYFDHVKRWWRLAQRHPDRVLVVYYEDMKADLAASIARVALFLGRDVSPSQLEQMAERCSFETMKGKWAVEDSLKHRINTEHFRKGDVGSWRDTLSEAQAQRVDAATRRHLREEIAQGLRIYDLPVE